jgi:uncharacterized membrane protein
MSEPVSFLVASGIVALIGAPLALKLVPPNRWYGFRTQQTLSDRELWFCVNRFAGIALLIAAEVTALFCSAFHGLRSGRSFLGLLAFAVPTAVAIFSTIIYARKSGRERDD